MIRPDIFRELDCERYARMAKAILCAQKLEMAIIDGSGMPVWKNFDSNDEIDNLTRSISRFKHRRDDACRILGGNDGCIYAYSPLGELAGKPVGNVIYAATLSGLEDPQRRDEATQRLSDVSHMLRDEVRHLYEVNSLAIELGDRYDELAMLRATEVSPSEPRESRHVLSSYIRKYAEHVDIDYACIWVPSRQYFFPAGRLYSPKDSGCERILHEVARCCYGLMHEQAEVIGINDNKDALLNHSELDVNQKILAVPVYNANQNVCGVLVSLNAHSKRDFTYSDRTTAEAVCKKIYKYLDSTEDPLTQLYNKVGFEQSVWRDVRLNVGNKHLALVNLRQFSVINGAYGTAAGDKVLKQVGELIAERIQGRGFAARIEADHFALLINQGDTASAESLLAGLVEAIGAQHFCTDKKTFSVSARCSLVHIDNDNCSLSDCLYSAQLALDAMTDHDEQEVVLYQPSSSELIKRKRQMNMVENIKQALDEDRFTLYAQNIRALGNSHDHYEILVRMLDENGEIVPPNDFIPTAERYRLMPLVDEWVFHHTLRLLDEYAIYDSHPEIKWGINLSGDSMSDQGFLDHVSKTIHNTSVSTTSLYFEITETAVIENYQNFTAFMSQVHSMGCRFALDDFGSGLCSFSYLKKLAVDYLKIDGSLVKDIVNSNLDHTIVSSVASIASVMGVKTIAEYVENDDIVNVLKKLGIDYAQGFGIMKPMPLQQVLESMQGAPELKQSIL